MASLVAFRYCSKLLYVTKQKEERERKKYKLLEEREVMAH
jgi:hypothetical protein